MPAARSGRPSHRDIVQVVLRHHRQVAIPRSYGPSGHLVYRPLRQLALHPPIDDSNKTLTSSASLMSIDASQSYCRPSECLLATRRRSDFRSSCLVLGVHLTCTHPTDPDRTAEPCSAGLLRPVIRTPGTAWTGLRSPSSRQQLCSAIIRWPTLASLGIDRTQIA
jgi:hypothetical protein